jgi:hypothetical protein
VAFKDGTKSGGRQKGTQNKSVAARHEVMAKVNAALNELGEDSISGMKLLQEVIRHHDNSTGHQNSMFRVVVETRIASKPRTERRGGNAADASRRCVAIANSGVVVSLRCRAIGR